MSSTAGVQNFLVNVFRPVYTYDATTSLFTPKLELSNIDTYSGNSVSVITAAIGDSVGNMYVGLNAGNLFSLTKDCRQVTALGVSAGNAISNVSNSVYVGYNAGAGVQGTSLAPATAVIGIGVSAGGAGVSNIFIGNGTGSTASNNILIGHGNSGSSNNNIVIGNGLSLGGVSNRLQIGTIVYGNLSTNWVGIGTPTPYDPGDRLDVNGNTYIFGQLGVNITPGNRTVDVNGNFRAQDAAGNKIDFTGGQVGVNRDPERTLDVNGTLRIQSNSTTLLDVSTSVVTAPGGYVSVRGSISAGVGTTTIGTLKRGTLHVATVDQASITHQAAYIFFASTTSNVVVLSYAISGDTDITTSGTSIQISNLNTTKTYDYSITYFPMP